MVNWVHFFHCRRTFTYVAKQVLGRIVLFTLFFACAANDLPQRGSNHFIQLDFVLKERVAWSTLVELAN